MGQFIIFFIYLIGFSFISFSQNLIEKLHNPVKTPLLLAGNFAELRPNHFHMGVDIKTQGREGLEILAANEGWLSRVKVSSYGYGRVLYIDHTNGTTTVYAHLSKLSDRLEAIVQEEQKEQQSWEIELFYEKDEIKISRGELIALSGNTGGSTAPHLHFEVRDTQTEQALNPLLNGLQVADTRTPEIRSIKLFGVQKDGYLLPGKVLSIPINKDKNGELSISRDTIVISKNMFTKDGGLGIAIDAFDKLNGAENVCGLYGSQIYINGVPHFGHEMNRISFENSRYINSHRDLSETGKNVHKLFRNSTNPLEIYKTEELGIIKPNEQENLEIEITGYDEKHNTTCVKFILQFKDAQSIANPFTESTHHLPADAFTVKQERAKFDIPTSTFYEPIKKGKKTNAICSINCLIQKNYDITFKGPDDHLSDKRYLAVGTKALKTIFEDGTYLAHTNVVGEVSLKLDTIPPIVTWLPKTDITRLNQVKFKVEEWGSGLKNHYLYINNEWTLLEYEYKTKLLFTNVNTVIPNNTVIRLEVIDQANNIAVYERIVNRK